jgi:hypothetical protein
MSAAELGTAETPSAIRPIPGQERLKQVVHEAAARIRRGSLTASLSLELLAQHLLSHSTI